MMYRDATARILADENLSMIQRHDMCLHLLELEKYDKCEFWLEQELERVREGRREHINKNNMNKDDKKATI